MNYPELKYNKFGAIKIAEKGWYTMKLNEFLRYYKMELEIIDEYLYCFKTKDGIAIKRIGARSISARHLKYLKKQDKQVEIDNLVVHFNKCSARHGVILNFEKYSRFLLYDLEKELKIDAIKSLMTARNQTGDKQLNVKPEQKRNKEPLLQIQVETLRKEAAS